MLSKSNLLSLAVLLSLSGTAAAANHENPRAGRTVSTNIATSPSSITSPAIVGQPTNSIGVNGLMVSRALSILKANAAVARVSTSDTFIARNAVRDADGTEHVRFERNYDTLPVIGGDLVVHSKNGVLKSTSQTLRSALRLSTRARIDGAAAIVAAGTAFGSDFTGTPTSFLAVYARGEAAAQLVYQVRLENDDSDMTFIVSARDGRIVDRWSNRETATGTGKTLFSGDVSLTTKPVVGGHELRDPTRGGGYTIHAGLGAMSGQIFKDADNIWGNNTGTDLASAAADAQFGMAVTWDYYKNIHGRNGIANNGQGAYNRVHYGRKYGNAFWSDGCFCMTFGDGDGEVIGPLVTLDIAGHEMSHGVTSRTANLIYSGESGGLNEATSDIFGTMVEFYANSTLDTPDYIIGELLFVANVSGSPEQDAIRYMFDPSKDGLSPNCYSADIGEIDVHFSSGPANRFFYLLAEGSGARTYSGVNHAVPTCNGATLAGIGRAQAEKIWYRALVLYMTSDTGYAGARLATLQAASDLYGPTSSQHAAVAATWAAVNVN